MNVTYRVVDTRFNMVSEGYSTIEGAREYIRNGYNVPYSKRDESLEEYSKIFIILPVLKE